MTLCIACIAQAQTEEKALVIEGYGEVYYAYDLSKPPVGNRQGNVVSHSRHNEVNVNLAMLKAMYNKDRVRANIGIMMGTYANANMAAEPGVLKNIYEANAGFRLHRRHELWIDAGVFPSHIGVEGGTSMDCPTLTRSLMADASPYYEAGARLSYTTISGKWYIALMHLNGWQRIQRQPGNSTPAGGMQVQFIPNKKLLFNISTFAGSDKQDVDDAMRYFIDCYTVAQLAKRLQLTAAVDAGTEEYIVHGANVYDRQNWLGASLMLKYDLNTRSSITARGEYFSDPGNIIFAAPGGRDFDMLAYSLGYNLQLAGSLWWRIEGKGYAGQNPYFRQDNGLYSNNYVFTTSLAVRFNNRKNHRD